jgi:hypothetical protein
MSTAASIALVFLIVEGLILTVIVGAIGWAVVYLMFRLRRVMKRVLPQARGITTQVATTTHTVSDRIAAPFIGTRATGVRARGIFNGTRRRIFRS